MAKAVSIRSEFPAVKKAAYETVREARTVWLSVAKETAEAKAADQAATRGYALQVGIKPELLGHQSARIIAVTHTKRWGDDPWILRLFEYGTVFIKAMPFIRPAARKANKAFVATMDGKLEGKIRRKAAVRRKR
jgi:hypothetical protein